MNAARRFRLFIEVSMRGTEEFVAWWTRSTFLCLGSRGHQHIHTRSKPSSKSMIWRNRMTEYSRPRLGRIRSIPNPGDRNMAKRQPPCRNSRLVSIGWNIHNAFAHVPLAKIPIICPVTVLKFACYAGSAAKVFKAGISHRLARHDWRCAVRHLYSSCSQLAVRLNFLWWKTNRRAGHVSKALHLCGNSDLTVSAWNCPRSDIHVMVKIETFLHFIQTPPHRCSAGIDGQRPIQIECTREGRG